MTHTKHTLGPWAKVGASIVEATSRNTIAVCIESGRDIPTIDANAALIAAAPDLLAALQAMVDYENLGAYARANTIQSARAAIAKATQTL